MHREAERAAAAAAGAGGESRGQRERLAVCLSLLSTRECTERQREQQHAAGAGGESRGQRERLAEDSYSCTAMLYELVATTSIRIDLDLQP